MFRFVVVVSLLLVPALARPDPLSLEAALALAEARSPDVAAQSAGVAAAHAAAAAAGRLPDPQLVVGIENLPVSGPERWSLTREAMTMRKVGLMQELPNGARRHAEADAARAGRARARRAARARARGAA